MRSGRLLPAAVGTVHPKREEHISIIGLRVLPCPPPPPPIMINKQRCVWVQDKIRTRRF